MKRSSWVYNREENSYRAVFPGSSVEIVVTCDGNTSFFPRAWRGTCPDKLPRLPLVESGTYHYRLSDPTARLHAGSSFVGKVRRSEGGLQPHTAVGYGRLWREGTSHTQSSLEIEVASEVINYKDHYQQFIQDITDRVAALQMYSSSATHSRLIADFHHETYKSHEALVREMFFIIGLVGNPKFKSAVMRIFSNPHVVLRNVDDEVDIRKAAALGRSGLMQIASARRRVACDDSKLTSLPERLRSVRRIETRDTKENRFVKHVLAFFRGKLERCRKLIDLGLAGKGTCADSIAVISDLDDAIESLRSLLAHPFFKDVGRLTIMPVGSVVLQRRDGYRDVLKKWIQFHAATNLASDDIDDIFRANQRNMATLYEYWCFFKLLDIVKERFGISDAQIVESVVGQAKDNVSFSLRRGKMLPLTGIYAIGDGSGGARYRKLTIAYFYNRVFSPSRKVGNRKNRTGWTFQMKPDYTLAFYPAEMTENDAVDNDLITYIHFDAKYKVRELTEEIASVEKSLRATEGGLPDDSSDEAGGEADVGDVKSRRDIKHVDILKMHAYRDAVYRTGGAYVLYPGDGGKVHNWTKYDFEDELFPAVGAFPMSPATDSREAISEFLAKTAGFLCDRITRWEEHRYQTHRIYSRTDEKAAVPCSAELLEVVFVKGLYQAVVKSGRCPVPKGVRPIDPKSVKWIVVKDDGGVPRVLKVKQECGVESASLSRLKDTSSPWGARYKALVFPVDGSGAFYVWQVEVVS